MPHRYFTRMTQNESNKYYCLNVIVIANNKAEANDIATKFSQSNIFGRKFEILGMDLVNGKVECDVILNKKDVSIKWQIL